MLERYGAVSAEAAAAMAEGARGGSRRLAVAVTGIAGGRRHPENRSGSSTFTPQALTARSPGSTYPATEAIRARSTVAALHLVRMLLARSRDDSV
jgi:nicotinamide mononucleotide (NMN) deamidase PncC